MSAERQGRSSAGDGRKSGYVDVVLATQKTNRYPYLMLEYIFHDVLGIRAGTVADVGCGRGFQIAALREMNFDTIGIDGEAGPAVDFTCDLGSERLPLDDNSVDVVLSKSVIEHLYLPQIAHYMGELRRVLKPGGHIVMLTPDWITSWDDFYDGFTHVTPFTCRSLGHCMQMYGFTDVDTEVFVQWPSVWRSKFMRFLADVTRLLFPGVAPKKWSAWIRWSKQRMVLGVGRKPAD